MTELQQNSKANILDALRAFSSPDEQIQYKRRVPFVHIPHELTAQWDNHVRLRTTKWYLEIWSDQELKNLEEFNTKLTLCLKRLGYDLDDVPEILENPLWIEIMNAAEKVVKTLSN